MCDVSGSSYFPHRLDETLYILALLNCPVAEAIFKVINPTINLNIKDIMLMPLIIEQIDEVVSIASDCINNSRKDWNSYETSWDFKRHPLV